MTYKQLLVVVLTMAVGLSAKAEVQSLSAESFEQTGPDEAYFVFTVSCSDASEHVVKRRTNGNEWCAEALEGFCREGKQDAAALVCGDSYLQAMAEEESRLEAERLAQAERQRLQREQEERARQARLQAQREAEQRAAREQIQRQVEANTEQLSIEEELLKIEQEKLELKRREFELQRRSNEIQSILDGES